MGDVGKYIKLENYKKSHRTTKNVAGSFMECYIAGA